MAYTSLGAPPFRLENVILNKIHRVSFKPVGTEGDGIGARLRLKAGSLIQHLTVHSDESFLSGNELRLHFVVADNVRIDELQIRWPGGKEERLSVDLVDRFLTITEGKGVTPSDSLSLTP